VEPENTADAAVRSTPAQLVATTTSNARGYERRLKALFLGSVLVLYCAFGFGLYELFAFVF